MGWGLGFAISTAAMLVALLTFLAGRHFYDVCPAGGQNFWRIMKVWVGRRGCTARAWYIFSGLVATFVVFVRLARLFILCAIRGGQAAWSRRLAKL